MANKIKLIFFALIIIFNYASGDLSNSSLPSNEGLNFNMENPGGTFCPTCPDWTNLEGWFALKQAYSIELNYTKIQPSSEDPAYYEINYTPKSDKSKWIMCFPLESNNNSEKIELITPIIIEFFAKGDKGGERIYLKIDNASTSILLSKDWESYQFFVYDNEIISDSSLCLLSSWELNPLGSIVYLRDIKLLTQIPSPVTLTMYIHNGSINGPIIPGALVTGRDAKGTRFRLNADRNGIATITGSPGIWSFNVSVPGYYLVSWSQQITATCTKHAYLIEKKPD